MCAVSLLAALGACGWADDKPYGGYNLDKLVKPGEYKGVEAEFVTEDGYLDLYMDYEVFMRSGKPKGITDNPAKEAVAQGDLVYFDYAGTAQGVSEKALEGLTGKGLLVIGSNSFLSEYKNEAGEVVKRGFEDQMVGQPRDKEFTVDVKFPDDYGQEGEDQAELNGKDAVFKCTVHKIGAETENITDDGVSGLTGGKYATIAEFRAVLRPEAEDQYQRPLSEQVRQMNQNGAFVAAFDNAQFLKIPEREGKYWDAQIAQEAERNGASADAYAQKNGYENAAALRDDQVKHELFSFAVAAGEGIAVTEEDLQELLGEIRAGSGDTGADDEIYGKYGGKGRMIRMLTMDKVSEFIYENAKNSPAAQG
jgi:trigger factor